MFREFRTFATSTTVKNNINIVKDKACNTIGYNCDCLNRWKEHYSELLNKDAVSHNPETSTAGSECPHQFVHRRRCGYTRRSSKHRKVTEKWQSGRNMHDNGRLLKFGGERMLRWLQVIINCVWITEKIPDDWRRGIILPFWKRNGDRVTCASHRGITLLSIPGKLLALILLRRSVSAIRSRRRIQQADVIPGCSTIDQIFALRQIIEKYNEHNRTL